jgi:hypothetical protein
LSRALATSASNLPRDATRRARESRTQRTRLVIFKCWYILILYLRLRVHQVFLSDV